jgi:hypothetical protein
VKPVKRTKKIALSPAMALAVARVSAGASGSKGTAGGMVALSQKCCVPASRMLTEASSVESRESSPQDPLL